MIDWETLTPENKSILINLKLGNTPIPLTEKEKNNLIHNCKLNNIDPNQSELIAFFEVVDERVLYENRDMIGQLPKIVKKIFVLINIEGVILVLILYVIMDLILEL